MPIFPIILIQVRNLRIISSENRISVKEYATSHHSVPLLDVRPKNEYEICHLENSISKFLMFNRMHEWTDWYTAARGPSYFTWCVRLVRPKITLFHYS